MEIIEILYAFGNNEICPKAIRLTKKTMRIIRYRNPGGKYKIPIFWIQSDIKTIIAVNIKLQEIHEIL